MNKNMLLKLFSLDDKVALITGASGGIGSALAEALAAAGAHVALNGRSVERLEALQRAIKAEGGAASSFPADVADLEAIPPLVAQVVEHLGRIDILVNCAGINRRLPIQQVSPGVYDEIMATNLRGLYFLSQEVARHMATQGGGKIIHIGSVTAYTGLNDVSVYGMGKSAIVQLTKTQAIEWAPHNIQVNNLCPGFIATELTVPLWQPGPRHDWIMSHVPQQRAGQPDDLVGLAIYLASRASDFTTGQSVYVDGGFTAGSAW
jgi:NAD(P)-dependent dehydrogenase (short-subunit alcohol dehydrogenase family)